MEHAHTQVQRPRTWAAGRSHRLPVRPAVGNHDHVGAAPTRHVHLVSDRAPVSTVTGRGIERPQHDGRGGPAMVVLGAGLAVACGVLLLVLAVTGLTTSNVGIEAPPQRTGAAAGRADEPPLPPLAPVAAVVTMAASRTSDRPAPEGTAKPCCAPPAVGVEQLRPLPPVLALQVP
ncbi:MAG: hypothetical protein AB7W59_17720 [Acidimicrobiia bacterium]